MADRTLDKEKFQRLLARAVEIEAERGDSLSEKDLLEAGRELGLSENSVHAALREDDKPRALVQHGKPFDTVVELEAKASDLRLFVPAFGLRGQALAMAGFNLFGIAFITFWTWGAAHGSLLFASFSIFFWVVFLRMASIWMRQAWQVDELVLSRQRGELRSRLGPLTWRRVLDPKQLRVAWKAESSSGHGRSQQTVPAHLVLEHGVGTTQLMKGRSEAELRWINEELGRWLVGG